MAKIQILILTKVNIMWQIFKSLSEQNCISVNDADIQISQLRDFQEEQM